LYVKTRHSSTILTGIFLRFPQEQNKYVWYNFYDSRNEKEGILFATAGVFDGANYHTLWSVCGFFNTFNGQQPTEHQQHIIIKQKRKPWDMNDRCSLPSTFMQPPPSWHGVGTRISIRWVWKIKGCRLLHH